VELAQKIPCFVRAVKSRQKNCTISLPNFVLTEWMNIPITRSTKRNPDPGSYIDIYRALQEEAALSRLALPPLDERWNTVSKRKVNKVFDARETRLSRQIDMAIDETQRNQLLALREEWRTAHRTLMISNHKLSAITDSPP
jgi:hypothetical protein